MGDLSYLPIWKKNATAAERFYELAVMAEKHPEDFTTFIVAWVEQYEEGSKTNSVVSDKTTIYEAVGVLEAIKLNLLHQLED